MAPRKSTLPLMGQPARKRLRDAIKRLIEEGLTSYTALVKSGAVKGSTLSRVLSEDGQDVRLEQLDWLAHALRCEPWQLLHPDPDMAELSPDAMKIARKMDQLPEEQRARAYALFVQAVDFANPPPAPPEPGASNGADGAANAPGTAKPIRLRHVSR
jgi:DNA-binding Xre family transcriptional regulator